MSDLQERYAAIQRKEEELKNREKALRDLQLGIDEDLKPNWPPCCPIIYHDIAGDIPIEAATAVKVALIGQLVWAIALLANMLACFGVSGMSDGYDTATYIVFGILYFVLGIPLAFRVNYMKFYQQCKVQDLTLCYFLLQLIFFGIQVFAAVSVPGSGLAGFLFAIDALSGKDASGYTKAMGFIAAAIWTISALIQFFILSKGFLFYKTMKGPSLPARST